MAHLGKITTVSATVQHPSYCDATWDLQPIRKGRLPVAAGRGGPCHIGWEVHGDGPIRIVFIMGLGSFKAAWQRQTLYFGHERHDAYSVLLIDNRGMGDSDRPLLRYSTHAMALDVLEVLGHVGFVDTDVVDRALNGMPPPPDAGSQVGGRTVHAVGISMGGMIAQELACLVPDQLASLSLLCTAAAIENTSPTIWENLASRAALLIPKGVEESVQGTAGRIFAMDWLARPDDVALPVRGTPRVGPPQRARYTPTKTLSEEEAGDKPADSTAEDVDGPWYGHFDSNYQRFVAQEMHKRNDARFTTRGFLLQLIACGWHYKSATQLAAMADAVDRRRILIMHGTADKMISLPHGKKLLEYIAPGRSFVVDGMGHAPMVERFQWFNTTLEAFFKEGEELAGR